MRGDVFLSNTKNIIVLKELLEKIKKLNSSKKRTSRMLYHKNKFSKLHVMQIMHKKGYIGDPHKNKNSSLKIFFCIRGSCYFNFFNIKGEIKKKIKFNKNNPIVFFNENKYFYNQATTTDNVILLEIVSGPFKRKNQVYLKDVNKNFPSLNTNT